MRIPKQSESVVRNDSHAGTPSTGIRASWCGGEVEVTCGKHKCCGSAEGCAKFCQIMTG
jgi:hypothetical protein